MLLYRVLLSHTGKAYAKKCFDETRNEFVDKISDLVYSGETIVITEDLDNLKETLDRNYEIVILDD